VCLTLVNTAFVLDHVNSVRPARSFTSGMRHNHCRSMTWIIDGSWGHFRQQRAELDPDDCGRWCVTKFAVAAHRPTSTVDNHSWMNPR